MKTHFGPFVFDPGNQLLWRGGEEVPLPPRVVGVLALLVRRPGEVVSRQELIDAVWKDAFVSDTSLAEAVSFLRQVLGDDPQQPSYIQTVHRRGYRFLLPPGPVEADLDSAAAATPSTRAARDPWAHVLPWAISVLFGAMAATAAWRLAHPAAPVALPIVRFDVLLPAGTILDADAAAIAWSPSGTRLAFVACSDDGCRLFTRALDEVRAQPVSGADGAAAPFFSPDESSIGFFADGKLKRIAVGGGAPVTIASARHAFGAVWLADGTIIYASSLSGGLRRVAAAGGESRAATALDIRAGELRHEQPTVIAGSRTILLTAVLAPDSPLAARIVAVSADTGQRMAVLDHASAPRFLSPNVLTFVRRGDLMAAAFDPAQVKVVGQPVILVPRVGEDPAQYAVSGAGSLAVAAIEGESAQPLAWAAAGRVEPLPHAFQQLSSARPSRDGARITGVKADDEPGDVWWGAVDRGTLARLTFEGEHRDPQWTNDGRFLVFSSRVGSVFNLYARPLDGTGPPTRITSSAHHQTAGSVSSDGRTLMFTDVDPSSGADIWAVALAGASGSLAAAGAPLPVVRTPFDESAPALSPDGRWLAYQSNESNRSEVYVRPFPGGGATVPISAGGGAFPVWSRDGRTLYYRARAGVMAVTLGGCAAMVSGAAGDRPCDPSPSPPIEVARGPWIPRGTTAAGAVLVEWPPGRIGATDRLAVTLQWTRELQRLLPSAVVSSPK